jgi:GT2 family glycosyltransferase
MKVDVVISYYRQRDFWPFVAWGLQQNAAHINRVLLVNDEPWDWEPALEGLPLVLLDHAHDGFGMTRSYNQGANAAETERILFSQGDLILTPDFLAKLLPRSYVWSLIYPYVQYIEIPSKLSSRWEPSFLSKDWRSNAGVVDEMRQKHRMFILGKGACFLVERAKYLALGGFDEGYAPLGPNSEDHDFAARWISAHGQDTLYIGGGEAWHLGDPPRERSLHKQARMPAYDSRARLASTLGVHFHHRYILWAGHDGSNYPFDLTRAAIAHFDGGGGDVRVDCLSLDWMPDASAVDLEVWLPLPFLSKCQIVEHLSVLHRKLTDDGQMTLLFHASPAWPQEKLAALLPPLGFDIEEEEPGKIVAVPS